MVVSLCVCVRNLLSFLSTSINSDGAGVYRGDMSTQIYMILLFASHMTASVSPQGINNIHCSYLNLQDCPSGLFLYEIAWNLVAVINDNSTRKLLTSSHLLGAKLSIFPLMF